MPLNLPIKSLPGLLVLLIASGCAHLPADVATEMSPPDGRRQNNYAINEEQGNGDTGSQADAP